MTEPVTQFLVAGDEVAIKRTQDCTSIMEDAKRLQAAGGGDREMRHVARIPVIIVEKYCQDNKIILGEFLRSQAHMNRMLNDPDLAYFRVTPGAV